MLFAGGGLFISMVATTMWMSNDVARMQEQERAKDAARCQAALAASAETAPATGAGDGFATAPAGDGFTTPAANEAPEGCDAQAAGGDAADPAAGGAMTDPAASSMDPSTTTTDPSTGLPIDPGGAATQVDPNTGLPIDAASQPIDPAMTGTPDPGAVAPTEGVAVSGF